MVYRYESDEDALQRLPHSGAEPSATGVRRASAGPSPSRFPTPDLPPPPRAAAEPVQAVVPVLPRGTPVPEETAPTSPQPIGPEADAPYAAGPESPAPPLAVPQAVPASAVVHPTVTVNRMGGRLWQAVVGGAAVLVLLAICGLGTAAVLLERESTPVPQSPPTAQPGAARTEDPVRTDLDSRDTDPLPLTAKEVFPRQRLVVGDSRSPYEVLKTQSSASCAVAASEDLGDLLVQLGCSQVVRGTVRSPDGAYLATAGLFNLPDRATAERVRERVREILQQRRGRFLALEADSRTEVLATAAARVAWQVRGHYVTYSLVVRADGQPVEASDPKAKQVLHDMTQLHLDKGVLERRADGDLLQPDPRSTDNDRTNSSGSDDD
ncbi:hypothetical protein [Micromonospora sp. NPDC023956]|uniref:hypothetical protein n=1 Tax=Micromonospora sp. NPDC023956 TaxID=3155722 RepID=UPI0033EAA0C1